MLEYHDFLLMARDEANEAARLSYAPEDESEVVTPTTDSDYGYSASEW